MPLDHQDFQDLLDNQAQKELQVFQDNQVEMHDKVIMAACLN